MKKKSWTLILCLLTIYSFSQKNKSIKKIIATTVVAKIENLTAEMNKTNLYLFINNKLSKKDTILSKKIDTDKSLTDFKIMKFLTKGIPLYCITWNEKSIVDTKLKKEEKTIIVTEICNPTTKTVVFSNNQTTNNTSEIHFLDVNQTVSETIQKVRREGFEFSLKKDGDIVLKNKTQENKMTYSDLEKKYINILTNKKR